MDVLNKISQKLKYSVHSNNRDIVVATCINRLNELLKFTVDKEEIFIIKHLLCELSKQLNTDIPFKLKNECVNCNVCDLVRYLYKDKPIPKLPLLRLLLENSDNLLWEDETLILLEQQNK